MLAEHSRVYYNPPDTEFATNYGANGRENINLIQFYADLDWVREIAEADTANFARIYSGPLYEALRALIMLHPKREHVYYIMYMTAEELDSLHRLLGGSDAEQAQRDGVTTCDSN